ncbi:MAG: hypothetical protein U0990_02090 [Candidatus Nanopelagicales bacterium]|nr:hypothetical protein [Candidatus Nanopelagicales bacterium]
MATATTMRPLRSSRWVSVGAVPVLLGLLCLVIGVVLAMTAIDRATVLGFDAGYLRHVLALDAPVQADLVELGPASDTVGNLAFLLALAFTCVAATLLLVASGFWMTSARTRHPEAAGRIAAIGLWLALILAALAVLPVNGGWREAGLGSPADLGEAAVEILPVAVLSLFGLLLLQFSVQQWGARMRAAMRGRT